MLYPSITLPYNLPFGPLRALLYPSITLLRVPCPSLRALPYYSITLPYSVSCPPMHALPNSSITLPYTNYPTRACRAHLCVPCPTPGIPYLSVPCLPLRALPYPSITLPQQPPGSLTSSMRRGGLHNWRKCCSCFTSGSVTQKNRPQNVSRCYEDGDHPNRRRK